MLRRWNYDYHLRNFPSWGVWSSSGCIVHRDRDIIGHLSHACKVIKPGRPFLRRLIELSTIAKELHVHHHLELNVATRLDLHSWEFFLEHWNRVGLMSVMSKQQPEEMVTSDASGHWGCGAVCNTSNQWFSIKWGECWTHTHITIKELLPIVITSVIWRAKWKGKQVLFRCDNATVAAIVNSPRNRHHLAMHYTRLFYLLGAVSHFIQFFT